MENKYYIPEINEFHIGFRYETSIEANLINNGKDNIWYTEELTDTYQFADLFTYSHHRVKYLDKTDIEELGWCIEDNFSTFYNLTIKGKKYELFFNGKSYIVIQVINDINNEETVFNGICKNYNELKRIMEQTMVHDEIK